jgi:phosphoribosylformylglycinamidine (FGAM) synthase-like amidotransferase family enzyme
MQMGWLVVAGLMMGGMTWAQDAAPAAVVKTGPVRVAVYDDTGSPRTASDFKRVFGGDPKEFQMTFVTAQQIREGVLKNEDVLVQGGGGAHTQSEELEAAGRDAIREFVKNGGGYLGICAGAYLASSAKASDLGILNALVVDSAHWARGRGDVELGFTPAGQKEIGESKAKVTVMYHQGPLLAPAGRSDLGAYTEVAKFDTEIAQKGAPHGVMQGTTALASGMYGKGRVFVISPHPEQTAGQEGIVRGALLWAAGRTR